MNALPPKGKSDSSAPMQQSTPPTYSHSEHSFNLQILIEMQKSIGQLGEAIRNIDKKQDKHDQAFESLESAMQNVKTTMAIAAVVLTIVLAVGGFFANKAWDIAVNHIEISVKK